MTSSGILGSVTATKLLPASAPAAVVTGTAPAAALLEPFAWSIPRSDVTVTAWGQVCGVRHSNAPACSLHAARIIRRPLPHSRSRDREAAARTRARRAVHIHVQVHVS